MGLHVGLDIGIASVGWCVLDLAEARIVGAGVRTFKPAENPNGSSLAAPRRLARSLRRRLRRRRIRMQRFRALIVSSGMLTAEQLDAAFMLRPNSKPPYELRVEALDRRLTAEEWARVLSQLCKRRGYKSMRLSEDEQDDDEGVVKAAIAENRARMQEQGYRTAGEMLWCDERFAESKRNKGDYKGVLSRELLLDEIATMFEAQRKLGSPFATPELEREYVEILSTQASITEGDELRANVGKCSLDRTNPRIPMACLTFERFRVLDKLANVRYTLAGDGERHSLTHDQRMAIALKAFAQTTGLDLTHVRKLCALSDDARFVGVRYARDASDVAAAEKKEKLPHPKSWHTMRKAVVAVSPQAWDGLAADPGLLDEVATVLTFYKLDGSVREQLGTLGLEPAVVEALAGLRFSKNGHLSRETIVKILPHLEAGLPYVDACAAAGLHHSERPEGERHDKLPAIPADELRNPVVLRALSQSRKVLNAIITTFGPIEELHVELGRDVARSFDERKRIEKTQKDNRVKNDAVSDDLRDNHGIVDPRGKDRIKYKLWKEQDGRCMYSGVPIDPDRMLREDGVAQVDHILPHRRSFDDGYMNKTLVTTVENQNKANRTPFEYLGGDERRWHEFEERVISMHLPRAKQERLLRRDFDERASKDFRDRNLIDMQYAARFFKNFVEENLRFSGDGKRPVLTVNGRATAYLRTRWRLQKVREEGDLHHALDAAVVAATTRSMVEKVSNFYSERPPRSRSGEYYDGRTGEIIDRKHVPEPWDGFRDQVEAMMAARYSPDPLADLENDAIELKPIFVSRMPSRSVRGEIHKETVKRNEGENETGHTLTSKRVRLENLNLSQLDKMVGRGHDAELYASLRTRLEAHGGDGAKAFAEPFYKPSRPGRQAPRVRSIRVDDGPTSGGTEVRGGIADNSTMVRTDVFEKDGKYYLVPVYLRDVMRVVTLGGRPSVHRVPAVASDAATDSLPRRAIAGGKAERDWPVMDDSYAFKFSLHQHDLVSLTRKTKGGQETLTGYFKKTSRSTASITIAAHDGSWTRESLGVQRALKFDKLVVDVLGRSVHPVRREMRLGFSHGGDRSGG